MATYRVGEAVVAKWCYTIKVKNIFTQKSKEFTFSYWQSIKKFQVLSGKMKLVYDKEFANEIHFLTECTKWFSENDVWQKELSE